MRVNQLATELNVTADTVRYYTRIGLLTPSRNPENRYKEYSEQDRTRLRFILSARQLGFSVEDITQILGVADQGQSPCPLVRRLIDQRLHETEQRFQETLQLRERMLAAVGDWNRLPDCAPTGHMICHLIEQFAEEHP